ncbi:ferric reductase like transmembrane component-domain-containing protein [Fimicolochytrium jonesii]|uniref:ferric reductase like transmembrane component-domain-containing protein n=1 Tax=Fimicolochytrium jonesii TaxID=1396493 RepID=UPI0022FE279D|nr:ferric reductase like transmembrane component-domain-containing protein [Fimicolochytrium jonesii]KAI8818116.1 ferric reductase like transmembrane component-domain-containing protein [Fimicolochytrium jonesii]
MFMERARHYGLDSPAAVVASVAAIAIVPLSAILGYVLMEIPCYADFCIEHVQPMAKTHSQVALGVFYAWMATLILIMACARKKPYLHAFLRRPIAGTSVGEVLTFTSLAMLLLFNFVYFWFKVEDLLSSPAYLKRKLVPARRKAFFSAMFTGKLTDVALGVTMLFSAKNTALQTLLGVSYEKSIRVHRFMGYFLVLAVAMHTILYVVYTAQYRTREDLLSVLFYGSQKSATHDHPLGWGEGNWMTTMGTYSTLILAPVFFTSLPPVRRAFFNLFYYSHFLVFPSMLFAWLHAASDFYYMIPGLGLYFVDLFLRLGRFVRPVDIRHVTREPTGHVRVDFAWPTEVFGACKPGQWVFVNCPAVSKLEWHPYSMAQAPGSETATIMFRPKEGKTKEFENALAARLFGASDVEHGGAKIASPNVTFRIDGPFGTPLEAMERCAAVLCFVGGTGLAPGMGVARGALKAGVPSVKLFWSSREEGSERVSLVEELNQEGADVHLYHTGATTINTDMIQTNIASAETAQDAKADVVHSTPLPLPHQGRMVFSDLLESHVAPSGRTLVFLCGSDVFRRDARRAAHALRTAKGGDIIVCEEGYEL